MKNLPWLALSLLLAACASNRIIIDEKGVSKVQYAQDRRECEAYAEQVPVGEEVAKGATRGGILGAIYGAIFGDSRTVARGAGVGAVSGGAGGAARAEHEKQQVVKNCLRGRGYKVLN